MHESIERIYKQGSDFSHGEHLPEIAYKAALRRMVKYCNDVLFVDKEGRFLLGQRKKNKAAAGVWYIGGQVAAFMDTHESLQKIVKRETGLMLTPSRFAYLGRNRYWFGIDTPEPHDALCDIYIVQLSDEEIESTRLDPNEYTSSRLEPYGLDEIKNIPQEMQRSVFIDLWGRYQRQFRP